MILDEIMAKTRSDLKERVARLSYDALERFCVDSCEFRPKDVKSALKSTPDEPYRIIAEVKKASPSKGVIRENFEPVVIANEYQKGGANAISVLTEPHWFKGDLNYLKEIRKQVDLPLLRKDFIMDKYQILEALAYGASFVLLIAKALNKTELSELYRYTKSLGLDVLFETHDEEDIEKAFYAGADIIGINHRNLQTFEMDMSLCEKLIPLFPKDAIVVAESGIYTHEQLKELRAMGADAYLVGEHFMRQDNISAALRVLKYNK